MIKVINSANTIEITSVDGLTTNTIQKALVVQVGMYFQKNTTNGLGQSPYGYGKRTPGRTTKTIVNLILESGAVISFDCDEVENQATWQGCQQANLIQAVNDISSWL